MFFTIAIIERIIHARDITPNTIITIVNTMFKSVIMPMPKTNENITAIKSANIGTPQKIAHNFFLPHTVETVMPMPKHNCGKITIINNIITNGRINTRAIAVPIPSAFSGTNRSRIKKTMAVKAERIWIIPVANEIPNALLRGLLFFIVVYLSRNKVSGGRRRVFL